MTSGRCSTSDGAADRGPSATRCAALRETRNLVRRAIVANTITVGDVVAA